MPQSSLILLKRNDTQNVLLADNVIKVGKTVNLFDLALTSTVAEIAHVDFTDILHNPRLGPLTIRFSIPPEKKGEALIIELYTWEAEQAIPFIPWRKNGSTHRVSHITSTSRRRSLKPISPTPSRIFAPFGDLWVFFNLSVHAFINVRTGLAGTDSVDIFHSLDDIAYMSGDLYAYYKQIKCEVIGWTPYVEYTIDPEFAEFERHVAANRRPQIVPEGEQPKFLIHYADTEIGDEHFSGDGAEEAARKRFDQQRSGWSLSLYKEIARG